MSTSIYDFSAKAIDGQQIALSQFSGKIVLVVNTASKCGFTPQYAALERLYDQYRDRGLVVLGFPCNQFLHQEPGTEVQIQQFCQVTYGVTFPMFSKINVRGKEQHPLYAYLTSAIPGALGTAAIKWNFTKFLIDRSGRPVARFASSSDPMSIAAEIEKLL